MARRERELPHGVRVKIDAHVGDDVSGDLRGAEGRVHGINATYSKDGQQFVNVKLADGSAVAVPTASIKVRQ